MLIVDDISDQVGEKSIQALENLLDQMRNQAEWNQALFAVLFAAGELLRKAYGDEAFLWTLDRMRSKVDGDPPGVMH